MTNASKYARRYFMPPFRCMDWAEKDYIEKAPKWCSVDLRDGNQALIIPMSLDEKLEFFKKLVEVGFKEIEIGFPAASETEYEFCRALSAQYIFTREWLTSPPKQRTKSFLQLAAACGKTSSTEKCT